MKPLPDAVSFHTALPGDGFTIATLRHAAWNATYRGIYPDEMIDQFDHDWHAARSEAMLNNPMYSAYLIFKGETPMGYLIWQIEDPPQYRDFAFCLQSLYLLPELQGRGVGRQAMEMVKQACRRAGYDRLYWQCHPLNAKAKMFYTRQGAVVGQRDEGHANPCENTVYFELRL